MVYDNYNRSSNAYDYATAYEATQEVPVRVRKQNQAVIDNRRRAGRMNILVVLKITIEAILMVAICCTLVYFYTSTSMLKRDIAKKEAEYNTLIRENEDFRNELIKNINLPSIKRKAKKLGMKNAKGSDVRYYETCCEEYVLQMEEFPIDE